MRGNKGRFASSVGAPSTDDWSSGRSSAHENTEEEPSDALYQVQETVRPLGIDACASHDGTRHWLTTDSVVAGG